MLLFKLKLNIQKNMHYYLFSHIALSIGIRLTYKFQCASLLKFEFHE